MRRSATAVALGAVVAAGLGGCGGDDPDAEEGAARFTDVVKLSFDGSLQNDVVTARNFGWAQVELREVANDTGDLGSAPGPDGGGLAVRLPAFSRQDPPPLAVLAVVPRAKSDVLAPAGADFRFGADFAIDAQNQGTKVDDGNNVVQRGLFADPGQYKIQVDGGFVSCRVSGDDGDVVVRGGQQVEPTTWYRVSCERDGDTFTLRLQELDENGEPTGEQRRWTEQAAIGEVRMAKPDSPLAIGGKLTYDIGVSTSSSDQFNGLIDNVRVSFAK